MDNKLPLGTIIRKKDDDNKYIIVGKNVKKDKVKYDYLCLIYPYGYTNLEEFHYINDKDVYIMTHMGNINYR